jgi:DNA-binding transcriptional regulator YdaS (Cro superfamily)
MPHDDDPPSSRPPRGLDGALQRGWPDIELYDLIDFSMPVGQTGIVFVAALTGWRESNGTALFVPEAIEAAYRRAASTLAFMALANGPTFQFIRYSQHMSTAQAATLCGASPSDVTNWESGRVPVPVSCWQAMADAATKADMRASISWTPLPNADMRPRTIRIYPDIPFRPTQQHGPPPC